MRSSVSEKHLQHLFECEDWASLPQYPTDAYYRGLVPTELGENLDYRSMMAGMLETNFEDVWAMCSRDILFFINTFAWTINPKDYRENPIRPFITWPVQNQAIIDLQSAVGNHDINIPKSRQMGASWICLFVLVHFWQFFPKQTFLIVSAKQDLVDSAGDSRGLFQKIDFLHEHMPKALLPTGRELGRKDANRGVMRLLNADNGSSIGGEATVSDLGRGGTYTAIFLDETSSIENAHSVDAATADATNCRIRNSTPKGRFGTGAAFFNSIRKEGSNNIWMHWTDHPEKRKGLYKIHKGDRVKLNGNFDWRDHYSFKQLKFTGVRPRSVWYDRQCDRLSSSFLVAQECDLDFHGSAENLIDAQTIERVLDEEVMYPLWEGRFEVDGSSTRWMELDGGPFRLWCPFDGTSPPRSEYVVGADVGAGVGGTYTSNSALFIFDCKTNEQVGEFACNTMDPIEFCQYGVAVCKWFGNALFVPEVNGGPGSQLEKELRECGYMNVYRRDKPNMPWQEKTQRIGYHTRKTSDLIVPLVNALKFEKVKLRSERVINELLEYEFVSSGDVKHAGSRESHSSADKGTTHGDIAIAACCAFVGLDDRVGVDLSPDKKKREMIPGTPGYRHEQRMKAESVPMGNEFIF